MYKNNWTRSVNVLIVFSILMFSLIGCEESTSPADDPPEIPPASTFVIDFSDFNQAESTAPSSAAGTEQLSKSYWLYARTVVGVWNAVLWVNLIVPTTSFLAAFNKDPEPEMQDDGTWVWAYSFSVLTAQFDAELHGKIVDSDIEWNMYISKEGEYEDFNWYSGKSKLTGTEGSWLLNRNPQNPESYLDIEWHRDLTNGTRDIKYTNVLPGDDENGSYIFHGLTTDTTYDAFFNIYSVVNENSTDIEWHRTNKNGRVSDARHFDDDGQWHYWDENFDNIE